MSAAKAGRVLVYCLLLWAPLPLGSNRPFAWAINGILASVAIALFLAGELNATSRPQMNWRPAAWASLGIAVWVGWMVVQALPGLPSTWWHPVWGVVAQTLARTQGAISIAPSSSWETIAQVAPCLGLAVVAMRLAVNRQRAEFLLNVVVLATTLVAVYGLAAQFVGLRQVFLLDADAYQGFLTGSFVGRSAAATYLMIGLAAAAAVVASRVEGQFSDAFAVRGVLSSSAEAMRASWFHLAAGAILVVAILNTGSRGGAIATVVALAAVATLFVSGRVSNRKPIFVWLGAALMVLLVFAATSGDLLLARFDEGVAGGGRLAVYRDTLNMIFDRPLLGQGAGAFAEAFTAFHVLAPIGVLWNRAHNTFLQMASELGVPVSLVVLATIGGLLVHIVRYILQRNQPAPMAIAAVGAVTGVAVQSLLDFSVQVQAVGLTLAVVLGAGVGESVRMYGSGRAPPPKAGASTAPSSGSGLKTVYVSIPRTDDAAVSTAQSKGVIPDQMRVYAFGDLHGRHDLLSGVLTAIRDDLAQLPAEGAIVVGLGDYIDRGPQSREVISELAGGLPGAQSIFLRGNHEQMLLDFLEDPIRHGPTWLRLGGVETLRSYLRRDYSAQDTRLPDYVALRNELGECIPGDHLRFLNQLPLSHQIGGYFFSHAGARPGIALDQQEPHDLLWFRETDATASFDKVVVHGHTRVMEPLFGESTINIDTGAYETGRVACVVLQGAEQRLLS